MQGINNSVIPFIGQSPIDKTVSMEYNSVISKDYGESWPYKGDITMKLFGGGKNVDELNYILIGQKGNKSLIFRVLLRLVKQSN